MTQFEADTAAAFVALAAARVEVGVIEAGLGGRLDATNVLPSRVTVLTSVGLEHTEFLGETELEIAAEKLAVLRDHIDARASARSRAEVEELARRTAAERSARLVERPRPRARRSSCRPRRRTCAATSPSRWPPPRPCSARSTPSASRRSPRPLELHGRMEVIDGDPPLILDAAHNPAGAAALAEALPAVAGGRPVVACLAVLADKDAAALVGALAPALAAVVATEIPAERLASAGRPGARALEASSLPRWRAEAGIGRVEEVPDPAAAIERARSVAHDQGGVVLVTGSHYLLRYAGA